MNNADDVRVTYTAKELLGRIDNRLESIDSKLDSKADIRDVTELRERMNKVEQQLAIDRDRVTQRTTTFSKREKFAGLLIAGCVGLLNIVPYLPIGGHHP